MFKTSDLMLFLCLSNLFIVKIYLFIVKYSFIDFFVNNNLLDFNLFFLKLFIFIVVPRKSLSQLKPILKNVTIQ